MPCLVVLFAALMPRTVMTFIALLTSWFTMAYQTALWPILGWFFMPYTTLAYMAAMLNNDHQINGGWMILMIVAVVIDLVGTGASSVSKSSSN